MLNRIQTAGLFVTGTDTGVGKTVIAAAIANWFYRRGTRVGVCKIAATGCEWKDGQLVSEDATLLAKALDNLIPTDLVCPVRFVEPLAPAVAAQRAGQKMDWLALQSSLSTLAVDCEVMIVEGVGGVMVPMDADHTVLDVAKWLGLAAIVVARPGLGTINHTLLTVNALRSAGVEVAGVIVNRYVPASGDVAQATNVEAIKRWGKVPVLCVVEEANLQAVEKVDWKLIAAGVASKPHVDRYE